VELTERGDRDMPSVVVPYAGVTPA
jgi:hypothetical protein